MSSIPNITNAALDGAWSFGIRHLKNGHYQYYFPWQNNTSNNDFESNLTPPEDVSVDAVVSSLYFNTIVFIFLMGSYELLRRLLPAVYSSRQRQLNTRGLRYQQSTDEEDADDKSTQSRQRKYLPEDEVPDDFLDIHHATSLASLPDQRPLDWIGPVFGIPWEKVREKAGLDGYFFLRYVAKDICQSQQKNTSS